MTKRISSKFKVYKQFGIQLWDKVRIIPQKKLTRGSKPNLVQDANKFAGIHGYAVKWTEKQIFKKFYGNISEKQLKRYVWLSKSTKDPVTKFVQVVESRLDVIIYRMFFADTVFSARQLINHGHITVNSVVVTKPSYLVKPGDIISTLCNSTNTTTNSIPQQISRSSILIFENIVRRFLMILQSEVYKKNFFHPSLFNAIQKSKKSNRKIIGLRYFSKILNKRNRSLLGGSKVVQSRSSLQEILTPSALKRNSQLIKSLTILKVCSQTSNVKYSRNSFKQVSSKLSKSRPTKVYTTIQQSFTPLLKTLRSCFYQTGVTNTLMTSKLDRLSETDAKLGLNSINQSFVLNSVLRHNSRTSVTHPSLETFVENFLHIPTKSNSTDYTPTQRKLFNFMPNIKINYKLLTGVYLRYPESIEVVYPNRRKINFNRVLNFYK